MKKVLSLITSIALASTLFAGCGSKPSSDNNATTTDAGNAATTTASAAGESKEVTLTMWSIATESDAFNPAYKQAIADFEANHPGVKVKHETFENESYKTKIKAAVAANELPDVFFTWAGGFSQSFVDSGKVLPLDDYYTAYKDDISMAALSNLVYDGKLYGSVMCTPVSVMWYNKTIFDKYSLTAPTTWDEMTNVCQTLKSNGVQPIATSVKDTWVLAMLHDGLTLKSAGPDKVYNALKKNGVSYSDPDFLASAQKIQELVNSGAFIDGATGLSNDEASAEFYKGNAAMYFTGSWMGGSIMTDAPNPDDFSVAPIPVINSSNAKITDFMGGGSDSLMVAASTKNPDLAAQLAFEITKGVSKYGYLSGAGVPAWKVDYDDSSVPKLTQQVAAYANGATSFTLWFDTLMESEDAGEYLALLQELYIGSITPEEFQKAMADQLEK
jgi:raffinose/stachyose/melibiose transport system substrate-binding protein